MGDRLFKRNLKEVIERRNKLQSYSSVEKEIINQIRTETDKQNIDNISRTKAYLLYFDRNREIPWAFLASMVSRNAGWNMTDLEGKWFPQILNAYYRRCLFMSYERANWLIFNDAFPQLLLYEITKERGESLFHLSKAFAISTFIESEWEIFLSGEDQERLMISQIINEQHIIQKPVIEHPFYKKQVFTSTIYKLQDWFHFSSVLFPVIKGELYGFSVHDFRKVSKRIELGTKLAQLLFHPKYYPSFYQFAITTEHTGSRLDYEQYVYPTKKRDTPFLRTTFPIIRHHIENQKDWYPLSNVKRRWYNRSLNLNKENIEMTSWYEHKQKQLQLGITLEHTFKQWQLH
ncbi:DUF2515 family protein [Bacillus sp. PS06]|uniref:DUF2515 family protein n=1 Tax=Bacillus sp. PS06 TaxID=2764176 RepID=UPI00177D1616|nr:DUF2515 family protein [Bacillus sp. PS06]MBD8070207.1 DUF2515 family protein [Bacillus sp. PS06]